jgi:hypothetical protein
MKRASISYLIVRWHFESAFQIVDALVDAGHSGDPETVELDNP